jgi:hypothetical protein
MMKSQPGNYSLNVVIRTNLPNLLKILIKSYNQNPRLFSEIGQVFIQAIYCSIVISISNHRLGLKKCVGLVGIGLSGAYYQSWLLVFFFLIFFGISTDTVSLSASSTTLK